MRIVRTLQSSLVQAALFWAVLFCAPAFAQTPYEARVFVVDLGSYLTELEEKYGPLSRMERSATVSNPVHTEQVIFDILQQQHRPGAKATRVYLLSNRATYVPVNTNQLVKTVSDIRRAALKRRKYRNDPASVPAANALTLAAEIRKDMNNRLADAVENGIQDPTLHVVWIGRRWVANYVTDAGVSSKLGAVDASGQLDSSGHVAPDACLGSPAADTKLTQRLAARWNIEFEMHLVGTQTAPSERAVRSLMHNLGRFDYTPAAGGGFEVKSKQKYLGTFLPGCSLQPALDPAVPSVNLGKDKLDGLCEPTASRAADPLYVIRCDEFDAVNSGSSFRTSPAPSTGRQSAAVVSVNAQGASLASATVDLLFSAQGHGRSQASSGRLGSWLGSLPGATEVELRVRIKTETICSAGDIINVEFDITDQHLNIQSRFHVVIYALPCNTHGAPFVTVPINIKDLSVL